ncbi:MAG TPA: helix-turn-helix domain-containing protein [Anaerolineae bacterium]
MASKREFLRTNEVAEMLGISPFTIRRYIQLRKLKAVKLEGSYRVRRADLKQFLKAREIETEEELELLEEEEARLKPDSPRRAALAARAVRPLKPENKSKRTSTRVQTRAERSKRSRQPVARGRKER